MNCLHPYKLSLKTVYLLLPAFAKAPPTPENEETKIVRARDLSRPLRLFKCVGKPYAFVCKIYQYSPKIKRDLPESRLGFQKNTSRPDIPRHKPEVVLEFVYIILAYNFCRFMLNLYPKSRTHFIIPLIAKKRDLWQWQGSGTKGDKSVANHG